MGYRILGFSLAHDSSVCVINDGELEYFGKEERYTRSKRDKQPFLAIGHPLIFFWLNKNIKVKMIPQHMSGTPFSHALSHFNIN